MGRFSKLEPRQTAGEQAIPDIPALETRPEPGALGAIGGPSLEESANRSAGEWLELGERTFLRGDTRTALRLFSRALDQDTTLAPAWVAMIRVLCFRGDFGQAETWANRALQLYPASGPLLGMRAVVLARRGMLRQALTNSEAVLTDHAGEAATMVSRGEVLLLADHKQADFHFTQALTLVPTMDWKLPAVIGSIYEERRIWARAVQYYQLASQRNETCPELYYRIARCRAVLGQKSQARTALEQARAFCPPDDPLLLLIDQASTGTLWNRLMSIFWKK